MPVSSITSYRVICDDCNKIIANVISFDELKRDGWKIDSNCYPMKFEDRTIKYHCPTCVKNKEIADLASDDLRTRIQSPLYKGDNFSADAIDYCGLKGHPKADKAFSMAYDRGHSSGYSEILQELERLAELLL